MSDIRPLTHGFQKLPPPISIPSVTPSAFGNVVTQTEPSPSSSPSVFVPLRTPKSAGSRPGSRPNSLLHGRFVLILVVDHPPPDAPQKKNQKTHLGDPQIYQVGGIDILKQEVTKSSQSRFFNRINSKTL